MTHLTPHTHEWFKALESVNPTQAAMSAMLIELAGRTDICSVCGDDPAKDYKIVGVKLGGNVDATIRLCEGQ